MSTAQMKVCKTLGVYWRDSTTAARHASNTQLHRCHVLLLKVESHRGYPTQTAACCRVPTQEDSLAYRQIQKQSRTPKVGSTSWTDPKKLPQRSPRRASRMVTRCTYTGCNRSGSLGRHTALNRSIGSTSTCGTTHHSAPERKKLWPSSSEAQTRGRCRLFIKCTRHK